MDPDFLVFAVLGGLALAGRLRRVASPAGRSARAAVQSVVRPAQRGARKLLPLGGGPVATVIGAAGTVIGEAIGEVLDGTAAAADWATGRRSPRPLDRAPGTSRATRPATATNGAAATQGAARATKNATGSKRSSKTATASKRAARPARKK